MPTGVGLVTPALQTPLTQRIWPRDPSESRPSYFIRRKNFVRTKWCHFHLVVISMTTRQKYFRSYSSGWKNKVMTSDKVRLWTYLWLVYKWRYSLRLVLILPQSLSLVQEVEMGIEKRFLLSTGSHRFNSFASFGICANDSLINSSNLIHPRYLSSIDNTHTWDSIGNNHQ